MQGLNEIQAYVLVYRWSLQHNNSIPEVSQDLLRALQQAYLAQRSYLLRSIEHLLLELVTSDEPQQSMTTAAITEALTDGLDSNLCESLATSLDPNSQQSLLAKARGFISAAADSDVVSMDEQDAKEQGWLLQQHALMEQEIVIQLAISVFDLKPCTPPCFAKVMDAINLHLFCSWHEDIAAGGAKARVAQLVSVRAALSVRSFGKTGKLH